MCVSVSVEGGSKTYLVIETTLLIEIVEELRVGFASPEVHITDFEVTPD